MSDYAISTGRVAEHGREGRLPSLRDVAMQAFYTRRLILACLVLGLVAGMVAAVVNRPTFTAESLLLVRADAGESVRDGVAGPASVNPGETVQRLLQSDIQILKSEPVVALAAQSALGPGASDKALQKFRKRFKVEALPNSNIIRVTFESPDRALSLRAAQGLIDAYRDRRSALYRSDSEDLQSSEITRAQAQITSLDGQIQGVRDSYHVLDIAQDIALASARLDTLRQRAGQVGERAAAVGGELSASAAGLASSPARVLDTQDSANASPNDEARNTLLRLRQEREHLAAQYAADYPGLVEIDRKIAIASAQVAANSKDRYRSDRTVRNPVHDQLETRRAGLLVEGAALSRQNGELGREIGAASARVEALRDADAQLRALARARDVAEGLYKQLTIARAGARLESEAVDRRDGALRVVQPPSAPLKGRDLGAGFVLAGLLVGIGAATALSSFAGLLRQVFLTPGEAERALHLTSVGEFEPRDGATLLDVTRVAALLRDTTIDGAEVQVVQVSGTEPAAKSAVAAALARALADRPSPVPGRAARVLLADPDAEERFRHHTRPKGDHQLRLNHGFLTVTEGGAKGVWVALDFARSPLGDPGADTADAKAFLGQLRKGFDWIVIAGEADFAAYEARRRFALVDLNLISVEAEVTRSAAAEALVETVLASGGDILGFVFSHRRLHIPKVLMRWL